MTGENSVNSISPVAALTKAFTLGESIEYAFTYVSAFSKYCSPKYGEPNETTIVFYEPYCSDEATFHASCEWKSKNPIGLNGREKSA